MPFRKSYVSFESRVSLESRAVPTLTIAGALLVPEIEDGAAARVPAVLVCHGSDGVDGRGGFHIEALAAAGYATLEIDMWAARGTRRGAGARPGTVPETLPDAFAALAFLARQPEVDPARIAVLGFSWGGVVAMLSATRRYVEALAEPGQRFAAHVAMYPALWSYNRVPGHEFCGLTGAPVLIQAGADDAYDDPEVCAGFLDGLDPATRERIRLIVHPGATHAFDRDLPAKVIHDPYAHKGAGGPVSFEYNPAAAMAARGALIEFLGAALAG